MPCRPTEHVRKGGLREDYRETWHGVPTQCPCSRRVVSSARDEGVPPPNLPAVAQRIRVHLQVVTSGQHEYIVGRRLHYTHAVAMGACGD